VRPRNVKSESRDHGEVLTAISDGLVALLKEFYGRGPMFILAPSDLVDEHEPSLS
jgi:hypothetical protein